MSKQSVSKRLKIYVCPRPPVASDLPARDRTKVQKNIYWWNKSWDFFEKRIGNFYFIESCFRSAKCSRAIAMARCSFSASSFLSGSCVFFNIAKSFYMCPRKLSPHCRENHTATLLRALSIMPQTSLNKFFSCFSVFNMSVPFSIRNTKCQ